MAKLLVDERMELKEGRKVVELGRVAPRADHFRLKSEPNFSVGSGFYFSYLSPKFYKNSWLVKFLLFYSSTF